MDGRIRPDFIGSSWFSTGNQKVTKGKRCYVHRIKNQTPLSQGRHAYDQRDGLLNCHPGLLMGYSTVDRLELLQM